MRPIILAQNDLAGPQVLADISRHRRFPDDVFLGSDQSKLALKIAINLRGLHQRGGAMPDVPAAPAPARVPE